jgi:deoxyribose-phosphate aldolase
MVQLLQAAAEAGDAPMVCVLVDFPAAQQLTKDQVMCVLRAAEKSGYDHVVRMCSRLMRN